ncbi:ROK family protein [Opitutaceae bacterium TAV4]|uniref:polyphosphate--glucose phosphotransferase n=1 Tax=Geminisphaera colitermitum TaxID=1148786 RepID=UPI00019651FD|nr:ROK family protein [Geminisphaera colitermitum]RRJ96875.1 ROK family protein [Opitutaceae bacterium TAV4]RRK00817.1 ROK family protein [Opitutaceae bacterium TAV3]
MNILGIDIGGSALKGAPVNTQTGKLLAERHRIATPKALTPAQMAGEIKKLAAHFNWKGPIGVGFPGVIQSGFIRTSFNLHQDFIDCEAAKLFSKVTGQRVALVNDADAAGLAEATFGAGKGVKGTVLMLTFGTGVGSALFADGRLYPNTEFGHLRHKGKSYEKFVSAAVREAKEMSFKKWANRVSDYINQLEAVTWPELIIVGGGISSEHKKWFKHLKLRTPIVPATFLNEAGIVGAALNAARS